MGGYIGMGVAAMPVAEIGVLVIGEHDLRQGLRGAGLSKGASVGSFDYLPDDTVRGENCCIKVSHHWLAL